MTQEGAAQEPVEGQDAGPGPDAAPRLDADAPSAPPIRRGEVPGELKVFDHGFVRLDEAMADDLSVVNGARVSFAVRKETMEERDAGLIRFLMRERHGSPFEHNSFRFHIRAPIFVAREWFRHRIGCLTGDAVVSFVDIEGSSSKVLNKTMDELWRMWSRGERNGHALPRRASEQIERLADEESSIRAIARETGCGRRAITRHLREGTTDFRDGRTRVRKMKLRVLNEETGEFGIGHVCDVIDKGLQPVYRVTLADGKQLTTTETHRVLTDEGWRTMHAAVGLQGAGEAARMIRNCRLMTNGAPIYQDRRWLAAQRSDGRSVQEIIDIPVRKGCRLSATPVAVVSVEYVGLQQTYDLSVAGEWHNFVANGIVVHNSFNEESARYHQLEGDFYVPDARAVRTQVGKPGSYTFEPAGDEVAARTIDAFHRIYKQLYQEYRALIDKGVAKELARAVLPFGIYTQFYWTLNARSLMNFLSLRNSEGAQYEIRTYAQAVERLFAEKMPVTYESFLQFGRMVP
jgi:thymidylate synthase ThyX